MFQLKKGILSAVQAGLLVTLATQLAACGEQPAPLDAAPPARVASASPEASDKANSADMPVIVVTASRASKTET